MLIGIESKRYSWSAVWSKTNKPTSSLSAADWKPTDLLFDLLDEHHHIQHNLDHLNLETRIFEPKEVYHETLSTPPAQTQPPVSVTFPHKRGFFWEN